ncbi:zinc ribbon domain-containing protein [Halovenus rubra]|uniref:Zinc ribbon domain-containing protein n=2 Tax=Halovenus rubra TaxID=869890 RepID=A0ABD5XDM3_9EURY
MAVHYNRTHNSVVETERLNAHGLHTTSWYGIPSDDVELKYTSQQCPLCGHTKRANRHKKRLNRRACGIKIGYV